jgi:hypothetical protein
MIENDFINALKSQIDAGVLHGCHVAVDVSPSLGPPGYGTCTVFVTFINLPTSRVRERRGGGAEAENNRMLFSVSGFHGGQYATTDAEKVTAEQLVCSIGKTGNWAPKMRKKTASPEKVAPYLAKYINDVARKFPPRYTHQ